MSNPIYPSQLTTEEAVAGFKVIDILDPHHFQGDGLKTIKAVVYSHGPSHRLIKMRNVDGRIFYKLEQYGRRTGAPDYEEVEWQPVGDLVSDEANEAVEDLPRFIRETDAGITSHVPPPIS